MHYRFWGLLDSCLAADEIAFVCEEQLSYRDKLRLAQLLIQLARKEKENLNLQKRVEKNNTELKVQDKTIGEVDTVTYIAERILKLRPTRKKSLENSVGAMFQFQGGISDSDKDKIIFGLQQLGYINIDSNNKVLYLK
jgi:hypothetical protein